MQQRTALVHDAKNRSDAGHLRAGLELVRGGVDLGIDDKVANRDLEDFKDVITPESQDFWRGQLLSNRDSTITVLTGIRAAKPPPVVSKVEPSKRSPKMMPPCPRRAMRRPASTTVSCDA